jgi:large subunit ribosomal protein L34e
MKKSSKYRKKQIRTRSGRNVVHYEKKKPSPPRCGRCKNKLQGLAAMLPAKLKKLTKSKRAVSRSYNNLCHKCVMELEKYITRIESGFDITRDLTIEKFLPKGWYTKTKEMLKKKAAEESKKEETKTIKKNSKKAKK